MNQNFNDRLKVASKIVENSIKWVFVRKKYLILNSWIFNFLSNLKKKIKKTIYEWEVKVFKV
jgi:hypothetical protein